MSSGDGPILRRGFLAAGDFPQRPYTSTIAFRAAAGGSWWGPCRGQLTPTGRHDFAYPIAQRGRTSP